MVVVDAVLKRARLKKQHWDLEGRTLDLENGSLNN